MALKKLKIGEKPQNEYVQSMNNLFDEVKELFIKKGQEYALDSNPFHNFDKAAGFFNNGTDKKALWSFLVKHLVSLKDYCEDTIILTNEQLTEKCKDVIIYTAILNSMNELKHIYKK